ncbi:chymotrypsin-2-like [Fopius arisanus]|uniref:Chymotrypsin-2-like n=1 Tax=Fopius arisanus TaxID=64838 RepID=A0A9R1TVB8_9HYME|nr:PREDICTED: chymotrypsin-2-like [Fopius arisanus]
MCPYTVGVSLTNHICGGSVLDKTHILTAAHCVKHIGNDTWDIKVITNTSNWYYRKNNEFGVSKAIIHRDFKEGLHNNITNLADIAVLKLDAELPLEALMPGLQTVSLPNSAPEAGADPEICGFGRIDPDVSGPLSWMYKLQMKTISFSECRLSLGDSGSPLVHNGEVIGVASWTVKCSNGTPQVFTDVFTYRDWIQDAMNWNDTSKASAHWVAGDNVWTTLDTQGEDTQLGYLTEFQFDTACECNWDNSYTLTQGVKRIT